MVVPYVKRKLPGRMPGGSATWQLLHMTQTNTRTSLWCKLIF
jgi:hypothetical protein